MRELRQPLRLYVLAVIAAGAIAIAVAPLPLLAWDDLTPIVALFAMSTIAQLWPVHLSVKVKTTVDDLPNFAAALMLGPFVSMAIAAGSVLVGLRYRSAMRWYNRAFNAAGSSLSTGAAAVTYLAFSGAALPSFEHPLPIIAAAIAKYFVQVELVDVAVALQMRRQPLDSWWEIHRRDLPNEAALYLLGALAAVSAEHEPLALALFAIPMAIVLVTMRESARIREQTKAAILELADLIDLRDPYTHGHSQRVAGLAERLARRMKLEHSQVELIRDAARVHDIGKIGTNDMVLLKPGALTPEELEEMRRHADMGHRLLRRLPEFWEGAELVHAHHERHDGTGYPRGLKGDELPLEVSVIAVADAYDAMTTDRPYRKALPWAVVKAELLGARDKQWRGTVVDEFIDMIDDRHRETSATPGMGLAEQTV